MTQRSSCRCTLRQGRSVVSRRGSVSVSFPFLVSVVPAVWFPSLIKRNRCDELSFMRDSSESLIGKATGLCDRVSHGSGRVQPARLLGAASSIGLYGVLQEAFP